MTEGIMIERDIATAERAPFFSRFSRLHAGALVTLRVDAPRPERWSAPHPAFGHPLPAARGEGHAGMCIASALLPSAEGRRCPRRMRGVALPDAAVAIVSRDGRRTEIRFRSPIRADLLDPAVE